MKILGIETSCDETAAAVVENGTKVLSNVIASSVDLHAATGGVVPEVAAREHIRQISPVIDKALKDASVSWDEIDAVAVTQEPGLIASLLIGINTAQTIAYIHKKPLIPINHISGHIYANWLDRADDMDFPILVLTISGGHNDMVLMENHHKFKVIGETLDDAAGEAFDKVARLLNLGFPGGPVIAKAAEKGDPTGFKFPRTHLHGDENRYNFSFSGLKSAVWREVSGALSNGRSRVKPGMTYNKSGMTYNKSGMTTRKVNDIAASFQMAVIDILADKLVRAAAEYGVKAVHLAGGVSANQLLRQVVRERLPKEISLLWPAKNIYCTDNAAMVASAGYFSRKFMV